MNPKRSLSLGLLVAVAAAGCNTNSFGADTGARACATAVACDIGNFNSISSCTATVTGVNNVYVARAAGITPSVVKCMAAAGKDCDAARRCLNDGQTPQACSGNTRSCDGNKLHLCSLVAGTGGDRGTATFDCGAVGEQCVSGSSEIACGLGTCQPNSLTCNGDTLQQCDGQGILHSLNCADFDSTCATTGIAHCRGKGPACTGNALEPLRCDGSTLIYCFDGQEARFDCGSIQTGCYPAANGQGFACSLGSECDPATFITTCMGTTLTFCDDGKKAQLDCGQLGFSGCDPNNGGSCK